MYAYLEEGQIHQLIQAIDELKYQENEALLDSQSGFNNDNEAAYQPSQGEQPIFQGSSSSAAEKIDQQEQDLQDELETAENEEFQRRAAILRTINDTMTNVARKTAVNRVGRSQNRRNPDFERKNTKP